MVQRKPKPTSSGRHSGVGFAIAAALLLATCTACRDSAPPAPPAPVAGAGPAKTPPLTQADIALGNQGVAEMGKFKYEQACDSFTKFLAAAPDSLDTQVNLAIATLNRQLEGDLPAAQKRLEDVLRHDAKHLRANYCLGLIKLYGSAPTEALAHFRQVAEADPSDAYAAYYTGLCLTDAGKFDDALAWYDRATERDPYLRSAYYGRFQTLQRLGKADLAKTELERFQRLSTNPQARLAEFKYSRMGPKASVLAVDLPSATAAKTDASRELPQDIFEEPTELAIELPKGFQWAAIDASQPVNGTASDIDHNGTIDLLLTGAVEHEGQRLNAVLMQNESGFTLAADHPLASVGQVNTALWGDVDNDGLTDVYLCRRGANQLWRQTEPGQWQDVTATSFTAGDDLNSVDGALFDADHDGDLDIYVVNSDGPNELFSNDLTGKFRAIAAQQGIAGDGRASRQVLVADLDNDRDADLIVVHEQAPHEVFINDLLWNYHPATNADALCQADLRALVAIDANADGTLELVSTNGSNLAQWTLSGEKPAWNKTREWVANKSPDIVRTLGVCDPAGTGKLLVLANAESGTVGIDTFASSQQSASTLSTCDLSTVANLKVGTGPALLGMRSAAAPLIARSKAKADRFAWLALQGKDEKAESMRSNRSGIGAQLAARVGSHWTTLSTFRSGSGPGQSLTPLAIGTGGAPQIDFVEINWSDGVFQTEQLLTAGKLHTIVETQRQLSSCPVLFAWNGREYAFVTDLLGAGGIGFAIGPGEYAPERPWENVLLPDGLLQPKQGRYELVLSEPMEEACYLDSLRLVAYDLPADWQMTLDERLATAPPKATGESRFYRNQAKLLYAENDRGEDVTRVVQTADLQPAMPGPRDTRFIGLCAEHSVTLTFAAPLAHERGVPLLVADGWTEYPYSQTMFAAWQADAKYDPPTVEARAPGGDWITVLDRFGYPAGMPRQMSAPLGKLPAGANQLRIRTNQEIYWDRLAVVWAEPCAESRRVELPLATARLSESGFPLRTNTAQHAPQYDFAQHAPLWDTRHQAGFFTAIGPCTPLLTDTDDAVAIFGPGEQIAVSFLASAEPPLPGRTRHFVLEAAGWCKDMDLYTKSGATLEPLPTRTPGTANPSRDVLHKRFHTRYRTGY